MASAFSHAAVGLCIGTAFWRRGDGRTFWFAGAACAALPDLDVLAFRFGIPYESVFGHRGLTHSLVFAAFLGATVVATLFRTARTRPEQRRLWAYLALATASHGALDALTNGGLGVAFFAPFDSMRYFFPWRPLEVSPLGLRRFFSARGVVVLWSEARWTFAPAALFAAAVGAWRWSDRRAVTPAV